MKNESRYREGTWFAVPLRDQGYAVGRVARLSPGGEIGLGYFFGPRRAGPALSEELTALQPSDAVAVFQFGALHLQDGKWPVIGSTVPWQREQWRIPNFIRREPLTERAWRVVYDDNDPNRVLSEVPISNDDTTLGTDALCGAGSVEIKLTRLLAN